MNKKMLSLLIVLIMIIGLLTGCGAKSQSTSEISDNAKTIKLGVLEDQTGDFSLIGIQKYHAVQLAVEEINAAGGVLGKQIEIVAPDTKSNNTNFQELAKKLILHDQVAAIMGCYSSASREAIRPIVEDNNALLFYNNQYEGGVASHNVFCTGAIPDHQITTLMEAMIRKYGPKVYTIAADYNFGQISADWVTDSVNKNGGQIVGQEYIPLNISQFSKTISNIKKAKPDVLVILLIGTAQSSFYEQWVKTGIKGLPMATTVNIAQAYEHKRFKPPALANMYLTATYMEELDTEESNVFKDRWHKKFPNEPYVGMEAETEYTGVYLWKTAVEKAGTTDVEKVIRTLESGVSYDGPAGTVKIDGATHHTYRNVYLAKCDERHNITFIEKWDSVAPSWLSSVKGIDLRKSAPNKQYTPIDK